MSNSSFKKVYVLDTNIILQDANQIVTLSDNSENLIVIPETVIDELDAKKSGFEEINFQAREFARLLADSDVIKMETHENSNVKIIKLKLNHGNNIRIDIISKDSYSIKKDNEASNIFNDRKILEIADFVNDFYCTDEDRGNKKVIFLSLDVMARTRALSMAIPTETLRGSGDNKEYVFHKSIEVNGDLKPEYFAGKDITDFDADYELSNFYYSFVLKDVGREILVSIQNGKIVLIDEDNIRKQTVPPKNKDQQFLANAILDPFYNIVISEAQAGCVTRDTKIKIRYK